MRVLVCGGRDYDDGGYLFRQLNRLHDKKGIDCIIQGGASGADALAERWAKSQNVPVESYPAKWKDEGKAAGPKRNIRMLAEGKPDGVVAFPGGKGTTHMVNIARDAGVAVWDLRSS